MSAKTNVASINLANGRVRAVVERILSSFDGGRFPVKRIVCDRVDVTADGLADGHDVVARALRWRRTGAAQSESTARAALGKARRRADFVVDALGAWPG